MRLITLLIIINLFTSCIKRGYTITTLLTTYDTKGKLLSKKLKVSYERYSADSLLLYKEDYADNSYFENTGKLICKTTYGYNGRVKVSETIENVPPFGLEGKKSAYTYHYIGNVLHQKRINGDLYETYVYDTSGKKIRYNFLYSCKNCYDSFIYNQDNLFINQFEYLDGILIKKDTFIYDSNKRLIEKIWFNTDGSFSLLERYIRDKKGKLIERKTKKQGIRGDQPIEKFDNPEYFWFIDKFYYNNKNQQIKMERYDHGVLTSEYEFVVN